MPDPEMVRFVEAQHLAEPGVVARWLPLTGGVSSDIWKVEQNGRTICVKRALPQLKVDAVWEAPVSRNAYEWAWMQFAAEHCPMNVPTPIAQDPQAGLFAMAYLEPEVHPVWKQQLLAGQVNANLAAQVGQVLGEIHAASAWRIDIAKRFDAIQNFYALRLEPYLVAAAARHPEISQALLSLVAQTAGTTHALVHGDVSPKNILAGPAGPVILDAECAWYGDPAFDLAFCLNHLLLKAIVVPGRSVELARSFMALSCSYLDRVTWESKQDVEGRAARLLPGLLLARIDGKSPVEYINDEKHKDEVRHFTISLIKNPPAQLGDICRSWFEASGRDSHSRA
jgi:5-methylthioribose kinase